MNRAPHSSPAATVVILCLCPFKIQVTPTGCLQCCRRQHIVRLLVAIGCRKRRAGAGGAACSYAVGVCTGQVVPSGGFWCSGAHFRVLRPAGVDRGAGAGSGAGAGAGNVCANGSNESGDVTMTNTLRLLTPTSTSSAAGGGPSARLKDESGGRSQGQGRGRGQGDDYAALSSSLGLTPLSPHTHIAQIQLCVIAHNTPCTRTRTTHAHTRTRAQVLLRWALTPIPCRRSLRPPQPPLPSPGSRLISDSGPALVLVVVVLVVVVLVLVPVRVEVRVRVEVEVSENK